MYKRLDFLYNQLYYPECTEIKEICTKDVKMARIPFELNENLKEEFDKRLKAFDLPSYQRLSASQLLRALTSLVITMDNEQLSSLLITTNKTEAAIENYLRLNQIALFRIIYSYKLANPALKRLTPSIIFSILVA